MSSQTQQLSNGQSTRPYNPKRTDAAGHSDHCLYQTFLTDEGRARSDWLASLIEDGKKQEALKHNVPELRNVYNKLYSAASTVAKSHQGASVSSEERRNTALHHAQGFVRSYFPFGSRAQTEIIGLGTLGIRG